VSPSRRLAESGVRRAPAAVESGRLCRPLGSRTYTDNTVAGCHSLENNIVAEQMRRTRAFSKNGKGQQLSSPRWTDSRHEKPLQSARLIRWTPELQEAGFVKGAGSRASELKSLGERAGIGTVVKQLPELGEVDWKGITGRRAVLH